MRYEPKKGLYWFLRNGSLVNFGDADHLRRVPLHPKPRKVLIDLFNPNPINAPLPIHSFIGPILGTAEANLRRLKGQEVTTCFWANDQGSAVGKYLAGLKHTCSQKAYQYASVNELEPAWGELKSIDSKALVASSLELWATSMDLWGITFDKIIFESDLLKVVLPGEHPIWFGNSTNGLYLTRSDGTPLYAYADFVAGVQWGRQYDEFLSYVGLEQKLFGQKISHLLKEQGIHSRVFKTVPLIREAGVKMSKRRGNTAAADVLGPFERLVFRWACLRRTDEHLDVDLNDIKTFPEFNRVRTLVELLKQPVGEKVHRDCLWLYYNVPALSIRQILDRIAHITGSLDEESREILWIFLDLLGFSKDLKLLLSV